MRMVCDAADHEGMIDLRAQVLRPGKPRTTAIFAEDHEPSTMHFVALDPTGRVIGCTTLIAQMGWQLRGMAVDPTWRGYGVGAAILERVHALVRRENVALWCNARLAAVGFYERCGWAIDGDGFDIPGIGPHFVMRWRGAE
jgi:GNAT superfamily N-acetyltransferase